MMQQINFMKNLSIAGGMLVLAAFGPGAIGIDARRRQTPEPTAIGARGVQASRARRTPLNCHCASGGKKLR